MTEKCKKDLSLLGFLREYSQEVRHRLRPEGRIEFGEREKKQGHCQGEASVGKGSEAGLVTESNESL